MCNAYENLLLLYSISLLPLLQSLGSPLQPPKHSIMSLVLGIVTQQLMTSVIGINLFIRLGVGMGVLSLSNNNTGAASAVSISRIATPERVILARGNDYPSSELCGWSKSEGGCEGQSVEATLSNVRIVPALEVESINCHEYCHISAGRSSQSISLPYMQEYSVKSNLDEVFHLIFEQTHRLLHKSCHVREGWI